MRLMRYPMTYQHWKLWWVQWLVHFKRKMMTLVMMSNNYNVKWITNSKKNTPLFDSKLKQLSIDQKSELCNHKKHLANRQEALVDETKVTMDDFRDNVFMMQSDHDKKLKTSISAATQVQITFHLHPPLSTSKH